jgi:hypothetical protein
MVKSSEHLEALLTLPKDYSLVFTYVITILNWTFDENKIDSAMNIYKTINNISIHDEINVHYVMFTIINQNMNRESFLSEMNVWKSNVNTSILDQIKSVL